VAGRSNRSLGVMKSWVRTLGIGLALVGSVTFYWNYQVHRKVEVLTRVAEPFATACKSATGCILLPTGWSPMADAYRTRESGEWVKTSDSASYQGEMEYVANRSDFELRWHIATDVYLIARGGANSELRVGRVVN